MLSFCISNENSLRRILFSPRVCIPISTNFHSFSRSGIQFQHRSNTDVYACNTKISSLFRAGKMEAARKIFDKMPLRDIVTWNSVLTGYWQNGNFEESKKFFKFMPEKNVVSWNSMIAACVHNGDVDQAYRYFWDMPKRNVSSWNAMISGLAKYERVDDANRLFDLMPWRNVISYTTMVDGYANKGEVDRARALFDQMPLKNDVSWTIMICGYVENGKFKEAKELFEQMPDKNVITITAMITGYCKEGNMENARILFEGIQCKDQVCWNAMMAGYVQNGSGEEALKLLWQMLRMGTRPDNYTLVSIFMACSAVALLREGMQTHVFVIKDGFDSNVSVCNALITMYSKCGGILDSEKAFRHIYHPDLVSWNTIIAACAQHGCCNKAIAYFDEMGLNDLIPDGVTFLCLFSACGHAGNLNKSMELIDLMVRKHGITPRSEHVSCLVDTLGRHGHLDKAFKIIQEMPFEADSGSWGALLAACAVQGNVELGEIAARKIWSMDPQNSGAYVLLSNIYAAAGMWMEVSKVRVLMKEQGIPKERAYSWMEIGSEVHLFLGGDIFHRDIDKIHLELKSLFLQMKSVAEIPPVNIGQSQLARL